MFDCNTEMDFLGTKGRIRKGKMFQLFIYKLLNKCYYLLEETLF